MATVDETVANVQRKIDREKALTNAANAMRQSTNNPAVLSRLDGLIKDGQRNINFFESKLRDLDLQLTSSGMENMSLQPGRKALNPLTPPQAPGTPSKRPKYSKLDLIKYDTPHLGPRIQLMMSQLEFKLGVENQYKNGIEKMVHLYQIEGDRKSKQDAEAKRIESDQKIQLLKHSLKRYEDLHVDIEGGGDDDDSLNILAQRKPLSGHLSLRINAVADVGHVATGGFSCGPETFVNIKVEDAIQGRTKPTRTDRWMDELHEFSIEKANEIEITVYDKTGDHLLPIGMLWIRTLDIAEEMRRKKIETELQNSGWVAADVMGGNSVIQPDTHFQPPPGPSFAGAGGPAPGDMRPQGGSQSQTGPVVIYDWFLLEPVGRIHLTMSFAKNTGNKQPFDLVLGRKGAVHQRKEDVVKQCGHEFVQQQFYSVMRCAQCGELLKYAACMKCSGCNYTCHKKCYTKVMTNCVTQLIDETDPVEEKLNYRIPHRFENFSNMGANWCCHCGYVLQLGRKQTKKCTECSLTCHAHCANFVPYFCGMSMEAANEILMVIKRTRRGQSASSTNMGQGMLQQLQPSKPLPSTQAPLPAQPGQEQLPQTDRFFYGKEQVSGTGNRIGLYYFNFLAVLGKGNFGKVMLAETKSTKQLYAIKVLKKELIIKNDEVESTRSEKRVHLIANKEKHPFLLNLHACFQTETRVYFVMEYISGGDLMLHIQRGQFGTERAQFYAAEVCLALKYFHENGVIYRDLKLDNILLTLDGHIKIADYGLCKEEMWYGSTTSTFCGTPEFMAPEILLGKKYDYAVDWWAFGVLIYQMLLQQSPFRGEDEDEIYDAILADEPLYPIHMPRDSVLILQKLITREPEMRLGSGPTGAQEIMSHAFFGNINWDDIYHKRVTPPFTPQITSPTDTSNFDTEFTSVTPVLTPVHSVLSQAVQEEFRGFSYLADFN